jgi:hypothetical protein
MNLRHLGAVWEMLAVTGKAAGPVGVDHDRIGEDHLDQISGLSDRNNLPIFVSPELGEREPIRHFHTVLVVSGNGSAAEDGEYDLRVKMRAGLIELTGVTVARAAKPRGVALSVGGLLSAALASLSHWKIGDFRHCGLCDTLSDKTV